MRQHHFHKLLAAVLLAGAGAAWGQSEPCGPLRVPGQYGPWDFRKDVDKLEIVMIHHFTPQVEMLIRGQEGSLGGDIDYTLRTIPNHPRALLAMANLGAKLKLPQAPGANYTVECYFERAIRFQPDDKVVRMIYVTYLTTLGRADDAKVQLEVVENLADGNPMTIYNLGLLYFDLKDYDRALGFAHKAIALGVPRQELQDKLKKAGRWVEPPAAAASEAASAASASAAQ